MPSDYSLPEKASWYHYIAPWPFRPLVVFVLATYFFLVTTVGQIMGSGEASPSVWFAQGILLGIPAAGLMAGIMALGRMWQRHRGVHLTSYVVFNTLASLGAIALRGLMGAVDLGQFGVTTTLGIGASRLFLFLLVANGVAGGVTIRLQRQIYATQEALQSVKAQQILMLEADEAARRQVAALLHDRVQAGLIAACLELQMMAKDPTSRNSESLEAVVARLENLRALDVRRAARALSPDVHDLDLRTALEELAVQYEPAMGTTVSVDAILDEERDGDSEELALAIYRIVEQALLNAATHGRAEHVEVTVTERDRVVTVRVSDDGSGLTIGPQGPPGLGSALLTTWTRLYEGDWNLAANPNGGAILTARLQRD